MPPPTAGAAAALCRDSDSPQPRSRGSMYCIWASSTCALPSRDLACWAKMSRIRAVRSITLTLTTSSSWMQLAGGELAVADHGVGAGRQDDVAQLLGLAGADVGGRVGLVAALDRARRAPAEPAVSASAASSASEFSASCSGAVGPDADQHDPLEAQLAVLDLGDVLELGGEAGDAAQRGAVGAVELVAVTLPVDLQAPRDVLFHQGVGPEALRKTPAVGRGRCGRGCGCGVGHRILTSRVTAARRADRLFLCGGSLPMVARHSRPVTWVYPPGPAEGPSTAYGVSSRTPSPGVVCGRRRTRRARRAWRASGRGGRRASGSSTV